MTNDFHKGDAISADSENPSHHHNDGVDLISSLPDEIIQHILSFIETKFAVRSTVLSRRWRHICRNIPSLYFDYHTSLPTTTELIRKTLIRYIAGKIISLYLRTSRINNAAEIDSWIVFTMSSKIEKLTLDLFFLGSHEYNFPDFFYSNSSLKQLRLKLSNENMIPRCTVSWTSLKNLSLCFCNLPDESAVQILSGCPVLESLTLTSCRQLGFLDLSKSLLLRRLDITCLEWNMRSMVIIAPHIHYLRLKNSTDQASTLVDVSSLTEAALSFWNLPRISLHFDFKNMLAKLHNVKRISLDVNFLQILSLAELNGVPFPTFKVEALTLEISVFLCDLTGITKMLQNSPELKKITIHTKKITTSRSLFDYLDSNDLWRVKDWIFPTLLDPIPTLMEAEAKFVLWLVESLLGNTQTVKTIVLLLGSQVSEKGFSELVQMVPILDKKVSIVLKRSHDYPL